MKRALGLAFLLVVACNGQVVAANHDSGDKLPEPSGKEVITYLNQTNYQSWSLWPGKTALYHGRHPHGAFLTTYVSRGAYQAIAKKAGAIPAGEFIVKENYTPEKQLDAITVMYRQPGYNADGGDWFWLKYKPDGTILAEGKVGGCIGCHAAVQDNDWLFAGPVK
jgi:hypothetical protein